MLGVSVLIAVGIILFIYSWKLKKDKSKSITALVGATGSSSAIAATSFCCCCLPVLYPVLALLFGSAAAAETLSLALIDSSGALFNVMQIGLFSLMTVSIVTSSNNIKKLESDFCQV
jgi:uncharacterized membrane protein HdeD (DUF308 family)